MRTSIPNSSILTDDEEMVRLPKREWENLEKLFRENLSWIQELQHDLKQKTAEYDRAKVANREIEQKNKSLQAELNETSMENKDLEFRVNELDNRLEKAENELAQAKKSLSLARAEARYKEIDLVKSETALAKSKKALAATRQELERYKQSYSPDEVKLTNAYMISF